MKKLPKRESERGWETGRVILDLLVEKVIRQCTHKDTDVSRSGDT